MTKPAGSDAVDSSAASAAESSRSINRETYLKHLLTQAAAAADESGLPLKEVRDRAIALVSDRTFPTNRDEAWRFTDLSDLLSHSLQRAEPPTAQSSSQSDISAALTSLDDVHQLVSINGYYARSISKKVPAPGVTIAPLSQLLQKAEYKAQLEPILAERLARVKGAEEVFTALNTAGFTDVMVVWVKADQIVDAPICIVRKAEESSISHLRTLVIAERHASLTLVETFTGSPEAADTIRCNTSVTELWLAEGAQVNHMRIQDESEHTFHIAKTAVDQATNSRYHCTAIDLGAQLSRHHLEVFQSGPQTDTHLYGLSALRDCQLADTHSLLTLTYPHSGATQIQKNIVDDKAHAVFNGRVFVSQEAQHTDASQLNRNLMLSSKARIDTKPELDIVADDVKCAHGATVSQLQADEVFYLQSRGISSEQAQRLLLYGFAMEIVEKISVAPLRQALSDRLTVWAS
ncbi:MAG: Fe-S cluster assembly protein SufD [Cyanobacteria bacterium J06632_3]